VVDEGLHDVLKKLLSVLGNWIIRLGFMNLKIADWTSGFRAVKAWIIKDALSDIENYTSYVFQVALLDTAIKSKAKIKEIPLNFVDRVEGTSKINSVQYTLHALLYVFMHSSFVRYVLVGIVGFIIDFGISFVLIDIVKMIVWLSTIISAETAIISNFILNNNFSFAHKKIDKNQNMWWSFFKFNLIGSGSLVIQALGMEAAVFVFGIKWWFVYKFFIIAFIIIPYSYFLYNKIVWKDN
jgi:dolichol-phosphate mannosyltransferase